MNNFQISIAESGLDKCNMRQTEFVYKHRFHGELIYDDEFPNLISTEEREGRYFAVFSDEISAKYNNNGYFRQRFNNILSEKILFSGWISEKKLSCGDLLNYTDGIIFISNIITDDVKGEM